MSSLTVIERALTDQRAAFGQVLPPGLPPERLIRTVLVSIERVPKLLQCSQQSVMNGAMSAAVLGLEVDGITGQGFLIPYGDKAQIVIGYKGYNTIAARADLTINGGIVREDDDFDYLLGTGGFVRHKPKLGSKAPIIGAWATAEALNRPAIVEVLGLDDILAIKGKSAGARKADSPWNDNLVGFPAMAIKTAKRRLHRSLPLMPYQRAAAMDGAAEAGRYSYIEPDGQVVIDGVATPLESPLPTRAAPPDDIVPGSGLPPILDALPPNARDLARTLLGDMAKASDQAELYRIADRPASQQLLGWLRNGRKEAHAALVEAIHAQHARFTGGGADG